SRLSHICGASPEGRRQIQQEPSHPASQENLQLALRARTQMSNNEKGRPKGAMGKLAALAVIVIGLLVLMRFLPVTRWLHTFNDCIGRMGIAGIFIFIAVYSAATVLLAPGAIVTVGAGSGFGCCGCCV